MPKTFQELVENVKCIVVFYMYFQCGAKVHLPKEANILGCIMDIVINIRLMDSHSYRYMDMDVVFSFILFSMWSHSLANFGKCVN